MLLQIQDILRQLQPLKRVVVGVSGGPDSVCLAILLKEMGYEVMMAHLNHQLRGSTSDEDAVFVRSFAELLRVPCVIEEAEISRQGNLEANSRTARYSFLENIRKRWGAQAVAVAHHQEDQVETILMNLHRGAGLRGLAGMAIRSGDVIRPLLFVTKKNILDFLKKRGQAFRHDESNDDLRFFRNRLRHKIIPQFKKENPYFSEELLEVSDQARQKLEETTRKAKNWLKINQHQNHLDRESFGFLEPMVKGEVLIQILGTPHLYSKNINKLAAFMETGKTGRTMKVKDVVFTLEYISVRMEKERKKRPSLSRKRITISGIRWGDWNLKKSGKKTLFARAWHPGDRFTPAGMKGTKKMQDFFTDAKIPRLERSRIPMIVNSKNEIVSVGNLRWSAKGRAWRGKLMVCKRSLVS